MLLPAGTLVSVKAPSAAVVAETSGEPVASVQLSQATPWVKGWTALLGT